MNSPAKRPRISIDVDPEFRSRLRVAAAKRDLTIREYLLGAVEDRLRRDRENQIEASLSTTAISDPVLAELWDNPRDAEYDRL